MTLNTTFIVEILNHNSVIWLTSITCTNHKLRDDSNQDRSEGPHTLTYGHQRPRHSLPPYLLELVTTRPSKNMKNLWTLSKGTTIYDTFDSVFVHD